MLRTLEESAERSVHASYFGRRVADDYRRRLAQLGDDGPVGERVELLYHLGVTELRLGDVAGGLEHLKRSLELVPEEKDDVARQVAFQLGVGYLRLGETENCCLRSAPESCILPIRGAAVHTAPAGSRAALEQFLRVADGAAAGTPIHRRARWLLNVAAMTLGEHPSAVPARHRIAPDRFTSEIPFPRFRNVAPSLGLDTFNLAGGAVVDDFDGDRDLDLFTTTWEGRGQCRFFRNEADGTFVERTEEAGLTGLVNGLNLAPADYDGDGHLDVLVLRGAWLGQLGRIPNSLIRNRGDGTFEDVTFEAGLGAVHYPTQVAGWADYDNDGDLDVFIGNETSPDLTAPAQLFQNDGRGSFTDVAAEAGVAHVGYPKGVAWGDYDADGDPDLYVSEYRTSNALYRNDGDGTFEDVAAELGVTGPQRSFPTWFWDFDNDGALDLFVPSYTGTIDHVGAHLAGEPSDFEPSALYRGDGRGGFEDVAESAGLTAPVLPMGANFGDLDGDGWLDFYLGTGDPLFETLVPNAMYRNEKGERFVDVTFAGGFGHLQKGHAVSFADVDSDGDLDVFEQMGGAFPGDEFRDVLYENPGFGNHWLAVRLVGTRSNRSAIGARLRATFVDAGERRTVYRHVTSGGSFGANPLRQTIGLGSATRLAELQVHWPTTGATQRFTDVAADQLLRIVEGEDSYERIALDPFELGPARQ